MSATQSRYSTVELECLAIIHAIQKCHYYLAGVQQFEVWTDHRPLVGAFSKHLHTLTNQRLMRMREKVTSFNFTVIWTPGKNHQIADALSRVPVFGPCEMSFEPEQLEHCLRIFDPSLTHMALVDRFSGYAWTTALRKLITKAIILHLEQWFNCLLYTSPSPRDRQKSRMPSSA